MIDIPKTLTAARVYRYGAWAGNPAGSKYREGHCAMAVWSGGRGSTESQCARKNGFGPLGLFCRQHNPEAQKKRDQKRQDKWDGDLSASVRRAECAAALHGIAKPQEAIEQARKALETCEETLRNYQRGLISPNLADEIADFARKAREALTPKEPA